MSITFTPPDSIEKFTRDILDLVENGMNFLPYGKDKPCNHTGADNCRWCRAWLRTRGDIEGSMAANPEGWEMVFERELQDATKDGDGFLFGANEIKALVASCVDEDRRARTHGGDAGV